MSKYIPKKLDTNKPLGQVNPKLKVKVVMNDEEKVLNEYDAFQMLSEFNIRLTALEKLVQDIGEGLNAVMDGMKAGAAGVTASPSTQQSTAPSPGTLKLPKLNHVGDTKEEKGSLEGGEKYYNSSGKVKLES